MHRWSEAQLGRYLLVGADPLVHRFRKSPFLSGVETHTASAKGVAKITELRLFRLVRSCLEPLIQVARGEAALVLEAHAP